MRFHDPTAIFSTGPGGPVHIKEGDILSHAASAATAAAAIPAPETGADPEAQSRQTLAQILSSLDDDKADDVVAIDLRGRSEMADHMVIASGRSSRQVASIAEKLTQRLKEDLGIVCKTEGLGQGDWVLIDAGDAVVHLFRPEVREFYQLEKMWLMPGSKSG